MSQQDIYDTLCRKCYISKMKPTKKEIKHIVLTEYKEQCQCCGRIDFVVDYIEE